MRRPGRALQPDPVRPLVELPPATLGYRAKNALLGPPLPTDQLEHERLGKPTGLAVFASDNLSSCAYATEEILRVLVPALGIAAFALVVPVTVAMLVVLGFLILSYRQTIKAYPSAGGAYVVTRDNFGISLAQVAGASLLTDYILTVSVSVAAGTAALVSAFHGLAPYSVPIAISFIAVVTFGNLRGVRESGKLFVVPTYFFVVNMGVLLAVGIFRSLAGELPRAVPVEGMYEFGDPGSGLLLGASALVVLKAFASGGSAVTGVEAISNGVPAFRPPEWRNARTTLVIMGTLLGAMFLGLSMLAGFAHVAPFEEGTPTVLSQVGDLVYGGGPGRLLYYSLQAATIFILVLAANTSFADFPRLASFQAGDSFMPRQLQKRGHRLVFSNGILFLASAAAVLVLATGAKVERLIPLYALGVFTSFTLSQAGMAKHHIRLKEPGWRRGLFINGTGAVLTLVVDVVLLLFKFKEGAWIIVVLIPVMVVFLFRLARQYQLEERQLETDVPEAVKAPVLPRLTVLVFIDGLDLAAVRAVQLGRSLKPDELRAVHFVVDDRKADELAEEWRQHGLSSLALELVDCPDRRLTHSALTTVAHALADGQTEVCVLLPDRKYRGFWQRILHDRTAEAISREVSRLPHANVTTVPFHLGENMRAVPRPEQAPDLPRRSPAVQDQRVPGSPRHWADPGHPAPGDGALAPIAAVPIVAVPIVAARWRQRVTVSGRIEAVRVEPLAGSPTLECRLADDSAAISVVFLGRRRIAGIRIGARLTAEGMVIEHRGRLAIVNPTYELHA